MKSLIAVLIFIPSVSMATLGQDRTSVSADLAALHGTTASVQKDAQLPPNIEVDAMTVKGTTIKQYSDSTGLIFAISWEGIKHPDLKVLLGSYFTGFHKVDASRPKGHRHLRGPIASSKVTITRGGVAFNLNGLAILNGKVPAGVNTEDLQ